MSVSVTSTITQASSKWLFASTGFGVLNHPPLFSNIIGCNYLPIWLCPIYFSYIILSYCLQTDRKYLERFASDLVMSLTRSADNLIRCMNDEPTEYRLGKSMSRQRTATSWQRTATSWQRAATSRQCSATSRQRDFVRTTVFLSNQTWTPKLTASHFPLPGRNSECYGRLQL